MVRSGCRSKLQGFVSLVLSGPGLLRVLVSEIKANTELRPVSALPRQHGRTVAGFEFSDDRRLVTGSYDNTVRV